MVATGSLFPLATDVLIGLKRSRARMLFGYLVLLAVGQSRLAGGENLELRRQGEPACTIVLAANPSPAARLAALELEYHVRKISGATLPVRCDAELVIGRRLLVGESERTRQSGFRSRDFPPREYVIAFRPETVVLIGRDWEDTPENRKAEGHSRRGESLQCKASF